jgi:hypothetical protein
MSIKVIVSMDVKDFDTWLKTFNSSKDIRAEKGIVGEAHRNLDNPNNAVVIGTAPSKEAFLAFFATPEQAERMQSAGVVSQPAVTFLDSK